MDGLSTAPHDGVWWFMGVSEATCFHGANCWHEVTGHRYSRYRPKKLGSIMDLRIFIPTKCVLMYIHRFRSFSMEGNLGFLAHYKKLIRPDQLLHMENHQSTFLGKSLSFPMDPNTVWGRTYITPRMPSIISQVLGDLPRWYMDVYGRYNCSFPAFWWAL